jgi:exopolysaccharide biosynthesis polyprenyl glycosylphosphotransferase
VSAFVESGGPSGRALLCPRSLRQTRTVVRFGRTTLVALAVLGAYAAGRGTSPDGLLCVALLTGVWLLALDVGRASTPAPLGPAVGTAVGGLVGLAVVPGAAMWIPSVELSPVRSLVMAGAVLAAVGVWDAIVYRTTAARRRVLVVGQPTAADAVAGETSNGAAQVDVVGVVPDVGVVPERDSNTEGGHVPVVGEPDALADVMEALSPDVVVVGDDMDFDTTIDRLLDVPDDGFRIVGFTSFFEHAFGRVPVSTLRASWFMSLLHLRRRPYARSAKRAFDVVAATLGLLLTAPLMVLVALLLWPSGGVLYRQTRLGQRGRCFTIVKFRTMRVDAEAVGRPVWSDDGDPRVTRLGRALRRAHVDELPQLLNVLRGDMSMVGPRPERPEFVELLEREVPFWSRRLLVKPGLTGWAQLKGGYASDTEAMAEKLSYDLWYLRNGNVLVDLAICIATALQMLSGLLPVRSQRDSEPAHAETR